MAKDFATLDGSHRCASPSLFEVSDPARRVVLSGGLAAWLAPLTPLTPLTGCAAGGGAAASGGTKLGFKGVPSSCADNGNSSFKPSRHWHPQSKCGMHTPAGTPPA